MMKYTVIRTDMADEQIREIILYINENFGPEIALQKLDELEKNILNLGDNPNMGSIPRYHVLRQQRYRVLVLEKNLVFYKVDDERKEGMIYAVLDERQDYLNIIRGL